MKIFKKTKSGFLKACLLVAMACPLAVSCYDDSALWDEIDKVGDDLDYVVDKLYSLEEQLNTELGLLKSMINGQLFISKVSNNVSTGVVTLTLSDGKTLELLPKADMQSMVTYVTVGGVNYWAYIDESGKKVIFKNDKGEGVPVATVIPEVVVVDGEYFIQIGGSQYPLGGNSVFSDYELITDELSGDVYAVTFTFGEDMTFTVTVDGACGFHFVAPTGGFGQNVIINDYFVPAGAVADVQIDARGVVDYVLQIPDGWRVKEIADVYMGTRYFQVTAPKKELIESGAAAAEGDLKVVAVLEGGKATISRLYVTTRPFSSFNVSYGKADVTMYNGLQKFVYGLCALADFDEAAILETAGELLTAYEYPAGYGLSEHNLSSEDLNTLAGSALVPGETYVFWALPALYMVFDHQAAYYVAEGTFETCQFVHSSVEFAVSGESFRDAVLTMELEGVASYYADVVPAADYTLDDVLYSLNTPGYYTERTTPMTYEGSVFSFAGLVGEKATEYVAWIAAAKDGEYVASDVIAVDFSTLNLTAGGAVTVTVEEEKIQAMDIVTTLSAEGAETVYYKFMTATEAKKYADEESRALYLLEKGKSVKAQTLEVKASESISKMKPETAYVLMAVASDSEGMYGSVLAVEYTTTAIEYNDLSINLKVLLNDPGNVVVSVESEEAEGFLYWLGKISDNTWKSPNFLGGTPESAQVFMYMNPDHSRFASVMEKYPVENGRIVMNDLSQGEEYIIVAMARDAEGGLSEAFTLKFIPNSVPVGNIVYSDDPKWEELRSKVKIDFITESFYAAIGNMPGYYSFNVTAPQGYTSYVGAATEAYFEAESVERLIVSIIEYVDDSMDGHEWVNKDLDFPEGYNFYHFPHGSAYIGYAPGRGVIWANQEFHDKVCPGHEEKTSTIANNKTVPCETVVYFADGSPIYFAQPYASGSTTEVIDKVFVVCQDLEGNCYEPFKFDVKPEWFANAGGRGE